VQDTSSPCHAVATQCQATWQELVKATSNASTVVKAQVIPNLREVNTAGDIDTDSQKVHEHNQVCTPPVRIVFDELFLGINDLYLEIMVC
jgi:hypothetical protein